MLYLIVMVLMTVVFQDFKERMISFWIIPALFGLVVIHQLLHLPEPKTMLFFGFINLSFLALQFVLIQIYFNIKTRKTKSIINQQLGLGDVLFLLPITLLFDPVLFIRFYVFSLIAILLGFLIVNQFHTSKNKTIPLAGGQACCLILFLLFW